MTWRLAQVKRVSKHIQGSCPGGDGKILLQHRFSLLSNIQILLGVSVMWQIVSWIFSETCSSDVNALVAHCLHWLLHIPWSILFLVYVACRSTSIWRLHLRCMLVFNQCVWGVTIVLMLLDFFFLFVLCWMWFLWGGGWVVQTFIIIIFGIDCYGWEWFHK